MQLGGQALKGGRHIPEATADHGIHYTHTLYKDLVCDDDMGLRELHHIVATHTALMQPDI